MENSSALTILLESILGKGQPTSKGNIAFTCPFPNCPSVIKGKKKFEVQLNTNLKKENPYHCWVCENKGKNLFKLFKILKVSNEKFEELKYIIQPINYKPIVNNHVELPKEFISLYNPSNLDTLSKLQYQKALNFIHKRGLKDIDVIKYNIGFCSTGPYENRIIIPSYDKDGLLNFFIARDFTNTLSQKYKNPVVSSKDIIAMELYVNWDLPIILVEGMFDFMAIKRNTIPLLGKVVHDKLLKQIIESHCDKIYIALDPDALKNALKTAEKLISFGKKVYMVDLEKGKDPSDTGFYAFLNVLENTEPLTFEKLLKKKLELI